MNKNMNNNHPIIIAEAGVNHNGDLGMAKELVRVAAEAGVDYVKFQTFSADRLVTRSAKRAEYQKRNIRGDGDDSQFAMLKKLELSPDDHFELMATCNAHGIKFLSTAFDQESLVFLAKEVDVDYVKVPSGELTNLPLLRLTATLGKPVLLSTGMANLTEVVESVNYLVKSGMDTHDICLLHCTTEYPAPFSTANLRAMDTMARATGCKVGYSDHTMGIEVAVAATAMGAVVIEKHFTLDRTLPGPDHPASLEPDELKQLVKAVHAVHAALGDGIKKPADGSELANRDIVRKSIVAACHIETGDVFSEANLTTKRPGTGISPMLWYDVVGKVAKRRFDENDMIEL